MYRPNQRRGCSGRAILNLIVIGIVTGVMFFVYDTFLNSDDPPPPTAAVAPTENAADESAPVVTPLIPATPVPTGQPEGNTSSSQVPTPAPDTSLFIPSIGVNAPVITAFLRDSTWDVTQLGTNVGYLQGTAWLDRPGNVVLSGHVEMSDGRTGVFASLEDVQVGDLVVLTENGEQHNYIVQNMRYVEPTDLSVVYPTNTDTLTLITCSDYNFFQNTYDQRLVVVAQRV